MASQVVRVDAWRTLAYTAITSSYQPLGSSFGHTMRLICLTNNTNGDMAISFDGTTDNLIVPANGFKLFDIAANTATNAVYMIFAVGTQVYVRYLTAPSSGAMYLECLYGRGE